VNRRGIAAALFGALCILPALQTSSAQVPAELERFEQRGEFKTAKRTQDGFTFFVPDPPDQAPIVTWGNGTFTRPNTYAALLDDIASHGFLVAAANDSNVGTGQPQKDGIQRAMQLFANLTARVCTIGHSQGGSGSINAAQTDPSISASWRSSPRSTSRATSCPRSSIRTRTFS
jgi:predicted dienelactone hydrolase